ncbi:hypothetical protein O181_100248 [Austropuccinia psidii MF-1]|uniref:CCHC-type domain-containing protein n=1 Tax=Austropuccinia psidii MF-1 TaxID=1389203 RepID=A0A9Q3JEB1_9BASI|nr:hypothetical protein [Austropuccinia psidii MF-1]
MKILKKCGGELEHALRRRCIVPCSTEEYINALEDIVTRTKIGITWKKLDIESPNNPFIKKDKPKEAFNPNTFNSNDQRKSHKCGGIGHLANNCLEKEKINEIVETEDHNDKEEESDSEKDTEESETSESAEINIINAQINNRGCQSHQIPPQNNAGFGTQIPTLNPRFFLCKLHGILTESPGILTKSHASGISV